MIKLNSVFPFEREAREFVNISEAAFDSTVESVATDISNDPNIKCLTLAGPTCSGKTTTASKLTSSLENKGRRARVISVDDFYFEKNEMEARGITDFEGHEAIDIKLFAAAVESLTLGRAAMLPTFDFTTRTRVAMTEYIPCSGDIYIFEGIQAIYPQITSVLCPLGYKSIFISVSDDISVNGTAFERNEIRLMRRTVRDSFHRATSVEYTMDRWPSVRENEEKNIFPCIGKEDYVINSMLPYEIFLIGEYYKRIAGGYTADKPGGAHVISILERLGCIEGTALDVSMIPMDSVFREFIA